MNIKQSAYKIKGMRRDDSYSSFNPEFSWENHNIRLTARDGNDLLSATNEKGNLLIGYTEYFRLPKDLNWTYVASYSGYSNTLIPLAYTYNALYTDYFDTLIPPTYSYTASYDNYSNTLINV